jgi:hypothetical protein
MNTKSEEPCLLLPSPLYQLKDLKNKTFSSNSSSGNGGAGCADIENTKNDLEWDRHKDFNLMTESETMSSYNLEERMTELVKHKFLEFEIMSNAASSVKLGEGNVSFESLNGKSSIGGDNETPMTRPNQLYLDHRSSSLISSNFFSDFHSDLFTPPNAITLDDLFDFKRLTQTCLAANHSPNRSISMPDLRMFTSTHLSPKVKMSREINAKRIHLMSKHLSLMNMFVNFQIVYKKRSAFRAEVKKEKAKCPCGDNVDGFQDNIKRLLRKFSKMFFRVFSSDNGANDELRASYSVTQDSLTYKLSKNGEKLYPIDEESH